MDAIQLIYRAAQEGVRNVVAHADASRVSIAVYAERDTVVLEVSDDGRGLPGPDLPQKPGHLGLRALGGPSRHDGCVLDPVLDPRKGNRARSRDADAMIRLLIVDDHAIVRQGLEQLFATVDDIDVVGTAADGERGGEVRPGPEAGRRSSWTSGMPTLDGVAATRLIADQLPLTRVVVLTSYGDESKILDALNAGAHGYLLKHSDPDDVIEGVRVAYAGDAPLDPRAGRVLIEQRRRGRKQIDLTPREREVLGLVGQGMANKQIARRLEITERTVKAHLTSVFQRIGVTDRVQAALWARQHLPRVSPPSRLSSRHDSPSRGAEAARVGLGTGGLRWPGSEKPAPRSGGFAPGRGGGAWGTAQPADVASRWSPAWNRVSFAYRPPYEASWLCVPASTIRPCSSTKIRSASRTVDSRCAMTIFVRPGGRFASAATSSSSEPASRAEVGSSRMMIDASRRIARAIATRCR